MIGVLVEIAYKGKHFEAFDEIKGKTTVKGVFKEFLQKENISHAPGIQQAARTDRLVSAKQNYLYFKTYSFDFEKFSSLIIFKNLKIISFKKIEDKLDLPNFVKMREYIYHIPLKYIQSSKEDILKRCEVINNTQIFTEYTNFKGKKLLNHKRPVSVTYENGLLTFVGKSFLPQQVRIMSSYILRNNKNPMNPKFLYLNKVILMEEE